jgi:outer membrane protein, heavy metal efflux system
LGTTAFARASLLLACGSLCLVSAAAWAGTPALALPQVIEYLLQNNAELNAFRQEKGIRDAARTRAVLFPNPTLELEAGTGALTGSPAESNLSIGVSQEFILAGKREKRLAVADGELAIYRWQLADRERTLRDEVKTAFNEGILAEQRVALAERYSSLNRQLLEVARERLAAGDIPELEMNLVQVELARSEAARSEAANAQNQSLSRLWTLMGLPSGPYPALTDSRATAPITLNPGELKSSALRERPDLRALQAESGRGAAEVVLARAEATPNLTAGLAVSRDTSSIEVGGVEGRDTAYTVGFKLSLPIPLFDKNQAGVQEARARQSSSEVRLSAASRAVEREVDSACTGFANAERVLALYRNGIVPQLEENLKLTQEAYRLGEVGILSVIEEQKKFFQVNDAYLTALHSRRAALAKLESVVAKDLSGGVQ